MNRTTLLALLTPLLLTPLLLTSCSPAPDETGPVSYAVDSVEPQTILPGTRLAVVGSGFQSDDTVTIRLDGKIGGQNVSVSRPAEVVDGRRVTTELDGAFFEAAGTREGTFRGRVVAAVARDGERAERGVDAELALTESLTPKIEGFESTTAAYMDKVVVNGSGLLLEGEGQTVLKASGTFEPNEGGSESVDDLILPLTPNERGTGWYVHTPEAFGLRSGHFEGTLAIENLHSGSGGDVAGNETEVTLQFRPPRIDSVSPRQVSRGQRIELFGEGFVPRQAEGRQRTSLIVSGEFTDTEGNTKTYDGSDVLSLDPDYTQAGVLEYVIRPTIVDEEELVGLGSEPGVFRGDIEGRIHYEGDEIRTPPKTVELTILPTKQIVHMKFLPGFSDSMRAFGLRNVEQQVRDRAFTVCQRDYKEYNVECRRRPPTEYADYITIEIGGRDPNGSGFFGLDNSEGVDTGNLRLDEVVGGRRATDEKGDNFMFGGVFVESFLSFSPNLGQKIPIESEKFDEIFGPFLDKLGGTPVEADEYPSGPRASKVSRAIETLGNIVGNTVVHEVGHALGLANTGLPGEVHHSGINPHLIMNQGGDRPFEQRAELDSVKRARWGKRDARYLERLLAK